MPDPKTPSRIVLNPDSTLCILYAAVKGVETHSEEVSEERNGAEETKERRVTTTIKDTYECDTAKKLKNKVRTIFSKYVVTVRNFTISDPARIAEYRREVQPVLDLIDQHNSTAQYHPVEIEFTPVPLAASLDAKAAQSIYTEIFGRLDAVRDHFARGDVAALGAWIARNKGLSAFLPSATATLVDDAIDQIKAGLSTLRARATEAKNKAQNFDIASAGRDLLADGSLGALDNAQGLVNPIGAPGATPPAVLAIVA